MLAVLKEMMNFKLLADPLFFLIGISNAFAMIGFYTPFVYLPNMAIVTGVSVPDASFLVSVILESFLLQGVFCMEDNHNNSFNRRFDLHFYSRAISR